MTNKKAVRYRFKLLAGLAAWLGVLLVMGISHGVYAAAAPTLASITPASGSITGGDTITLSGTNFAAGDTVTVGNTAASNVTVVNGTTITAVTPAAAIAHTVNVTVTDSSGAHATLTNAFTYTDSTLIGWYKLDGNGTDSSASGNNGAVTGTTPTSDRYGATASALNFNGTGDYVNMGNVDNMGTGSLTVSIWFKTTQSSAGGNMSSLVTKSLYGTQVGRYGINRNNGLIQGFFADGSGAGVNVQTSETPYIDGAWHLATMAYDRTGSASLYIDGTLSGSTSMSTYASVNMTNSDNLYVGVYNDTTGKAPKAGSYFNGSADDVRIYNRALTATDVTALYNDANLSVSGVNPASGSLAGGDTVTITGAGFGSGDTVSFGGTAASNVTVVNSTTITATTPATYAAGVVDVTVSDSTGQSATLSGAFIYNGPVQSTAGLIGWWPLDGNANDMTSYAHNGTVNGTTPTTDRYGTASGAYSFNGTSNYIDMGNVNNMGTSSFTVSTWFKTTQASTGGSVRGIVEKSAQAGQLGRYYIIQSNGALAGFFGASTTVAVEAQTSETPYIDGNWHLVTMVYDRTGSESLYVDGTLKASADISAYSSVNMTNVDNLYLGVYGNSSGTSPLAGSYFNGSLDDVRIYNQALSPTAVTNLYASSDTNVAPTLTGVSPATGGTAGGSVVTISGTNFVGPQSVTFDGTPATNVQFVNSTTVTAVVPAGSLGTADVSLTDSDGQTATLPGGYTYIVPPAVTVVSPASGSADGGDSITISGTDFQSGATVTIGGTPATGVQFINATTLTAITPAGTTGAADVVVNNPDGGSATLAAGYTYQYPAPIVSAISPSNGPPAGGTAVTVTGSNFQRGVPLTTTNAWASTGKSLPAGNQVATTAVVGSNIYMYGGSAGGTIIYTAPTSDPTSWTNTGKTLPAVGTGAAFVQIGSKLYLFGGNNSNIIMTATASDPTSWTIVSGKTLPTTLSWSRLAILGSTLYLFGGSTATCAQGNPVVNKIYSASVSDPTSWTNTGKTLPGSVCGAALLRNSSNLYLAGGSNGSSVTTAIYTASLSDPTSWTNTGKTLPAGSVYNNTAAIIGSTAYIFGGYDYTNCSTSIYSAPVSDLTTWSSAGTLPSRLAGSTLAIAGNNVYLFGGSNCSVVTGTIYKAPVTRGPGTNYNPAWISDPTVYTSISLGGGALGSQQYVSSTQLTGTTAAHASGPVDVVAMNSDGGTGTLTAGYTYTSAPTITGVTPNSGAIAGGDSVTISGTNFVSGATVTIGGNVATSVTVVNSTTITATTPTGTAGSADVVVTNPDGGSATLTGGYTYVTLPTIGTVSPSSGDVAGGYTMTISGGNFTLGDTVTIGGTPATDVTVTTKNYAIGDAGPGGGIIFYDKGNDTDGWRYLEAAPSDQSTGVAWCSSWTNTGASGTAIGTGQADTATIIGSSCSAGAAKAAANYAGGGYTDWFLPSKDELNQLYVERSVVGGIAASDYWSSSQGDSDPSQQAWKQNFSSGAQQAFNQTYPFHVRAIRQVNSTVLTATVPAAASAGTVDVTVTDTNGQSATLPGGFTYMNPAPTITNISPSSGTTAGGDSVTITGTNFASGDTVTIGGTAATGVTVVNSTTITATTPAGVAGVADIVVRDSSGSFGTLTGGFTYKNPPPSISSFTPTVGKMQGGTTVTFSGSGFTSTMVASFGGVAATTVGATSTSLTVKTPAGSLGDVAVTISAPDTQTVTAATTFRYAPDAYAFTTSPLTLHATEPGMITIEARDQSGTPVSAPYDITLSLASSSGGGSFSTDGTSWGTTSITLPANQSAVSFYYKDANTGTPSLTVTGPASVSVSQTETITSRYKLLVTGVSDPIDAGVPSSVTVQATDWQGNPVNDYTGTIHFSSDDTYASLPANFTLTSAMQGHHTFVNGVTMVTTGDHCVTATDTANGDIAGSQCNITVMNGFSGTISKLALITDPQSTGNNVPTSTITVETQDSSGNAVAVPVDTTLYVNSNASSGSFSADGTSGWSSTQPFTVTIKANTAAANVYYKDTINGTKTLSFRDQASTTDTGYTDTSQTVYVGAGAPASLALSAASSAPYGTWVPVTVTLKDSSGTPATNADSSLPLYFTSDNAALQFSASSSGSSPAANLAADILVGSDHVTVYASASSVQTATITASDASPADGASGLADDSHAISFVAPNPSQLTLSTNATTAANTPVGVTLTTYNNLGELAARSTDTTFSLSDSGYGGSFSLSNSPWSPVSSVVLPGGDSSVTVYYKATNAGSPALSANGGGLSGSTSLTITPGAYTQLAFTAGPSSVPVSEATSYTVTTEDAYGNVTTVGSNTPAYLYTTSGSGSFATGSSGPWTATSVTIPSGGSSASFYYHDTTLGQNATLTASDATPLDSPDTGIVNATMSITVVGQTATQLVFTTSAQSITAGTSSGVMTVEAEKADGSPAILGSDLKLSLTSNSAGSYGFTATQDVNAASITTVTIPAGSSTASFYYHDTKAGSPTLQATGGSLSASQSITITASTANRLSFVTAAQDGETNQPSQQIEIATTDAYGNAVSVSSDTVVNLSSSCSDSSFSLSSSPWSPVTQLTIPSGSGTAYYYFQTSASSCTITVAASGFTGASQTFTASTGPTNLALTSVPGTLEEGQSASLEVSLEDASGNLVPALSATTVHLFASGGTLGQSSVTIAPGNSTASFTFTAAKSTGTATVQARDESNTTDPDTGLVDTSANIDVITGAPTALAVSPPSGNATVSASKQLTVTLTTAYGVASTAATDTVVTLASDGSGSFTASSNTADPSITTVTIPAGSSTASVYYHQTATGTVHLTMSANGLTAGTSQITFSSGSIINYEYVSAPATAEIGQTRTFGIEGLDTYGNVVTMQSGQHIYLHTTSGSGSFGGSGYDSNVHALVLPSATTVASFSYRDTTVGSYTLTASDTYPPDSPDMGIVNATSSIAITAGVPTKIVFTSAPSTFERGGTSNQLSVEVENAYGIETPVASDTTLTLTSDSSGGQFASSNTGPWNLTSVVVPNGTATASFYYHDNTNSGSQTITVSNNTLAQATQRITVLQGAPVALVFTSAPQTLYATHTSPAITLGVENRYGYPTVMDTARTIALSSTSNTAQLASTVPNWGITSASWPSGVGSISFYYRDASVGTATLSASNSGLTSAAQNVTVAPQVFDHLLVTNISDPQVAGTPNSVVVIAQDAENYTVASYSGTVHFTSSDPTATLPADYTFQPALDKGLHTFTNGVVLNTPGEQTVTATDTASGKSGSQQSITVQGAIPPSGGGGGTTTPTGPIASGGTPTSPGTGGPVSSTPSVPSAPSSQSPASSTTTTDNSKKTSGEIIIGGISIPGTQVLTAAAHFSKRVLSSPATPYVVPGAAYLLIAGFAGLLLWDMYREVRTADILLAVLKRERQTAEDKKQFLNLVAHHVRTPITIIAGGAELAGSLLAGDRTATALSAIAQRLQATANQLVQSISSRVTGADEAEMPAQVTLERKLYLSPLFWMPIVISLALTWLINWLATAVGHQNVHAATIALQLLVAAIVAAVLYSALRGRNLRRRRKEALQQSLAHRQQLDDGKNAFVQSAGKELQRYVKELMPLDADLQQKQPAGAKPLHNGVQQLQKLVDTLSTLSSIETTHVRTDQFELAKVLDQALLTHNAQIAARRLDIATSGNVHEPLVQDQHLLSRVTDTLLDNAIAFSPEGGKIYVNTSETDDGTILTITDSGPGLPKAITDQLLQPFTHPEDTFHESHQGLGLSLYLDSLIMRHLGGSLKARSSQKGTTVTLTIPKTALAS